MAQKMDLRYLGPALTTSGPALNTYGTSLTTSKVAENAASSEALFKFEFRALERPRENRRERAASERPRENWRENFPGDVDVLPPSLKLVQSLD